MDSRSLKFPPATRAPDRVAIRLLELAIELGGVSSLCDLLNLPIVLIGHTLPRCPSRYLPLIVRSPISVARYGRPRDNATSARDSRNVTLAEAIASFNDRD